MGADRQRLRQPPQQPRRAADVPQGAAGFRAPARSRCEQTIFLSDPNRVVPFHITTDPSPTRFLTGADFDLESIQPMADGFWIGEEFGPYLIHVDAQGRVLRVVETMLDGEPLRSPDHPAQPVAGQPDRGRALPGAALGRV